MQENTRYNKIKILHINSNYILTSLHQKMIENLNSELLDNYVFSPIYYKRKGVILPKGNVKVVECFHKWHRYFFNIKQRHIIRAAEKNYDIGSMKCLHAYTLFTDGNCARRLSNKYNLPYCVAVRNTDVNDFFKKRAFLRMRGIRILADAKRIFFLSGTYRDTVYHKYIPHTMINALEEKTVIIPNGIDDFWIKNVGQRKKRKTEEVKLIYAGRIDKNKNIPSIQSAMEILRNNGIESELTVVGRVEDKNVFKKIKQNPYTTYYPSMDKEKLMRLYRENDIFVMPSHTESFGLVYPEAMSQGLPVIYTQGQGFDGQFPEGEVGYHVNADNIESIADGIKKILDNYEQISARCVLRACKFNWQDICKHYEMIYSSIIDN